MRIAALVPGLMDRSRFDAIEGVTFVRSPEELASVDGTEIAVVDLAVPGALEAVSTLPSTVRKVGFASHIDDEGLRAAKAAGIEAMPRSRFFSRIAVILPTDQH